MIKILGVILIITSFFDAIKYWWFAQKIIETQSAKPYSRKGLNFAILHDIVKITYGLCLKDFFITFSSLIALVTMSYCWWTIYLYYPYKTYPKNKIIKIQRPNILRYFWNSLLPNRIRRHL